MNPPWYQKSIPYVISLFVGIFLVGQLTSAYNNAKTIPLTAVVVFSVLILLAWGMVEFIARRNRIPWVMGKGKDSFLAKIKGLGWQIRLPIIGILLALWIPVLVNSIWFHDISNPSECIKPFSNSDKFRILILPFLKNGTTEKGNLGAEIEPIFIDIIEEHSLDVEFYYLNEYKPEYYNSSDTEMIEQLRICNEADMVIYGRQWYSPESGQGRISVQYNLDSLILNFNNFLSQKEITTSIKDQPIGMIGDIEKLFFNRQLKDLQKVEQLIYWLSFLSEGSKNNYMKANELIDKALVFDSTNIDLSFGKMICLINLKLWDDADKFISSLRENSNLEEFKLFDLVVQINLNNEEQANNIYEWIKKNASDEFVLYMGRFYYFEYKLKDKDIKQVHSILSNEIELYPESTALKDLMLLYLPFEENSTKLQYINSVLQKDSTYILANLMKSKHFLIQRDFKEAINYIDKAINQQKSSKDNKQESSDIVAEWNLGDLFNLKAFVYSRSGDYVKANQCIDSAIKIDDKNALYFSSKADLELRNNHDLEAAMKFYEIAYQLDTQYVSGYLDAAIIYLQQTNMKIAQTLLNKYYALGGIDNDRTHFAKGYIKYLEGNYREAIDIAYKGVNYNSSSVELNELLGRSYYSLNEFHDAQPYLERALELEEGSIEKKYYVQLMYYLYLAYFQSGDILKAYTINKNLLQETPTEISHMEQKIYCLYVMGWHSKALEYIENSHGKIKEGGEAFDKRLIQYYSLIKMYECDNYLGSIDFSSLSPEKLHLLVFRANILACNGDSEAAKLDLDKITKQKVVHNSLTNALLYRASALFKEDRGDLEGALKDLESGIKILESRKFESDLAPVVFLQLLDKDFLNVDLIEFYLTKSKICSNQNDWQCAENALEQAKQINPDYLGISVAESMLEVMKSPVK